METIYSLTEFNGKKNAEEVEFALQIALAGDDVPEAERGKITLMPRQIDMLIEADGGKLMQLRKYNDQTAAPGLVAFYNESGELAVAAVGADFDLAAPDASKFLSSSIFALPREVLAVAGWLIAQTIQYRTEMSDRPAYGKAKEAKKQPLGAMSASSLAALFSKPAPAPAPAPVAEKAKK